MAAFMMMQQHRQQHQQHQQQQHNHYVYNNEEDDLNNTSSDTSSSDFFSPISCYALGGGRVGHSSGGKTPRRGQQQQPHEQPRFASAEKLPPLHDSSWIGARLSPIGSFDQEAAAEDDDDDDNNNHADEEDRLTRLYHKSVHQSLQAAASRPPAPHPLLSSRGGAAASHFYPNERTSLLRGANGVGGRRSQPPGVFKLHPLWEDDGYQSHHNHYNNTHDMGTRTMTFEHEDDDEKRGRQRQYPDDATLRAKNGGSRGASRCWPSFGTLVCTLSGLYFLAMLAYDCYTDFFTDYSQSRSSSNTNAQQRQGNGESSNSNNGQYVDQTAFWSWSLLRQLLLFEQHTVSWMVRPRWSTVYLFGALLPHDQLVAHPRQFWRLASSAFLTTSLVEWIFLVLAWRLVYLAATGVPWHSWSAVFFASVLTGQVWMLAWDNGTMFRYYDNSYVAGDDAAAAQQQQQPSEQPYYALSGCVAWGTCGVLCHVGLKSPSRRLVFFVLATVLVLWSLLEQYYRYGSVWGAVGGAFLGWATAASSEADRAALRQRDKLRRRHHDNGDSNSAYNNIQSHPLLLEHDKSSADATLCWLDFIGWLHRILVAALVLTPVVWVAVCYYYYSK